MPCHDFISPILASFRNSGGNRTTVLVIDCDLIKDMIYVICVFCLVFWVGGLVFWVDGLCKYQSSPVFDRCRQQIREESAVQ